MKKNLMSEKFKKDQRKKALKRLREDNKILKKIKNSKTYENHYDKNGNQIGHTITYKL